MAKTKSQAKAAASGAFHVPVNIFMLAALLIVVMILIMQFAGKPIVATKKAFVSKDGDIAFKYPVSWDVREAESIGEGYKSSIELCPNDCTRGEMMTIVTYPNKTAFLDRQASEPGTYLEIASWVQGQGPTMDLHEDVAFAGTTAKVAVDRGGPDRLMGTYYFIEAKDAFYQVVVRDVQNPTMDSEQWTVNEKMVVDSLKFQLN